MHCALVRIPSPCTPHDFQNNNLQIPISLLSRLPRQSASTTDLASGRWAGQNSVPVPTGSGQGGQLLLGTTPLAVLIFRPTDFLISFVDGPWLDFAKALVQDLGRLGLNGYVKVSVQMRRGLILPSSSWHISSKDNAETIFPTYKPSRE